MQAKDILPGDKVDIQIVQEQNNSADNKPKKYVSSVFDVTDDGKIILNMPTKGGKLLLLPVGIRYEFVFSTSNGLFKANGTVESRFKKDNFFLVQLALTSNLVKFQRRDYFRLDVNIPIMFLSLEDEVGQYTSMEEVRASLQNPEHKVLYRGLGTTLDISGGGMRFLSDKKMDDVRYLYLQFEVLIGGRKKKVDTVIALIASEYNENIRKYIYRGEFQFKETSFREDVIRYIFEEERRIRSHESGQDA